MTSMRERAEELGGSFTVASSMNKGTKILTILPVNSQDS
jgi:signal transduction histidine kinase